MGQILDCMFALFCMVIIDFLMMAMPASRQGSEQLRLAWEDMTAGVHQLFDGSIKNTRPNDGHLFSLLNSAKTLGHEGAQEPRYWRTPFKGYLFDQVVTKCFAVRFSMICSHYSAAKGGVNGAPKNPFFLELTKLDAFQEIGALLQERMALIG